MKITLALLALLLSLVPAAHAQRDLSQDQVAAYVLLVKADRARDRKAPADALAGYREAQQAFRAIAQKDPRWQPDVVKYRLAYCENEIEKLTRLAGGESAPAAESAPTRDLVSQATTDLPAPALKPAAEPDPAVQAELAQLRQDRQAWQGEKQALLVQLQQLQAATSSLAAAEIDAGQVTALEEQNNQLRADLAKLEQAATEVREDKGTTKALKKLEQELTKAKAKQAEAEAELKAARETAGSDQAELAQKLEATHHDLTALQEEKQRLQADLTVAQELAENRFRELNHSIRQLEDAQKQVTELTQAREQAVAVIPEPSETTTAAELAASAQARQALEQQVAELTAQVESLKTSNPAALATTEDADALPRQVMEMGEKLATAGRQLDASREAAISLLTGSTAKQR
jgi:DNA repair exonuclease SbcCD ATPase subunit